MTAIFRTIVFIGILILSKPVVGQENANQSLGISFQKIDIGRGLQLNYNRNLGAKWWFNTGLYVHFNALPYDDQAFVWHNRGWANKWYEHLGAGLSINRNMINYKETKVFLFYNAHVLRISYRTRDYIGYWDQVNNRTVYVLDEGHISDPTWTWENTIGVGIKSMISKKIGFTARGGFGISLFYDKYVDTFSIWPRKIFGTDDWGGMTMFSTGLFYKF